MNVAQSLDEAGLPEYAKLVRKRATIEELSTRAKLLTAMISPGVILDGDKLEAGASVIEIDAMMRVDQSVLSNAVSALRQLQSRLSEAAKSKYAPGQDVIAFPAEHPSQLPYQYPPTEPTEPRVRF